MRRALQEVNGEVPDDFELPQVLLTSSKPGREYGLDALRDCIGRHERELFGYLVDLQQTMTRALATFRSDLSSTPSDSATPSARPAALNEGQRDALLDRMTGAVQQALAQYRDDMANRCAELLQQLQQELNNSSARWPDVAYNTMMSTEAWKTLEALAVRNGVWDSPTRGPFNVHADVVNSMCFAQLNRMWENLQSVATTQLKMSAQGAINQGLQAASEDSYFQGHADALLHLAGTSDITAEGEGNSIAYTDNFAPAEIRRVRRGFVSDLQTALSEYSRRNDFYRVTYGRGMMVNTSNHTRSKFAQHRQQVWQFGARECQFFEADITEARGPSSPAYHHVRLFSSRLCLPQIINMMHLSHSRAQYRRSRMSFFRCPLCSWFTPCAFLPRSRLPATATACARGSWTHSSWSCSKMCSAGFLAAAWPWPR